MPLFILLGFGNY